MKKIFITITRGWIARNLLHNDFYKILREKYEIAILTPASNSGRFAAEFAHPNVRFLPFNEREHTTWDQAIFFFHKNLIYNGTVEQKNRWGILGDPRSRQPSAVSFLLKKAIFLPLSNVRFLRDIVRFLDNLFLQRSEVVLFQELIRREKPSLIISTNINADSEAALIKAARRESIPTIGFPKSWDNLNKHGIRAKTDMLVVWSDFMKDEAVTFQNYAHSAIEVVGIPQFDDYAKPEALMTREAFCELYGLDPDRRIILFGSEGNLVQSDSDIASLVYENIERGAFLHPAQLLIRPHYGYKDDEQKFKHLFGKPHVVVDLFNTPSEGLRDRWDYSEEFTHRFVNCLYHSDMMISSYSTLSLDAAAFDKPVINVAFDGTPKPYAESVARWETVTYFAAVLQSGAVRDVHSKEELRAAINAYFAHPELEAKERAELRSYFCFAIDGKSGKRFAAVIERELEKTL